MYCSCAKVWWVVLYILGSLHSIMIFDSLLSKRFSSIKIFCASAFLQLKYLTHPVLVWENFAVWCDFNGGVHVLVIESCSLILEHKCLIEQDICVIFKCGVGCFSLKHAHWFTIQEFRHWFDHLRVLDHLLLLGCLCDLSQEILMMNVILTKVHFPTWMELIFCWCRIRLM